MDYIQAQEDVRTWIGQYKIAYFKPHEIITQLCEENGELAKAIMQNQEQAIREELADVTFALLCMSNSHDIVLQQTYQPLEQLQPEKTYFHLVNALGQVAREVNHIYGPKKKKATEEKADLQERLHDAFIAITTFAQQQHIQLQDAFTQHMHKLYGRDNNRWEKK